MSTLAGMTWLQVMAPNFSQGLAWVDKTRPPTWTALHQLWGLVSTGMPARSGSAPEAVLPFPAVDQFGLPGALIAYGVFPALALLGAARLWQRGWPRRALALVLPVALPLAVAFSLALDQMFYPRFVFFCLPPFLLLVAVGADAVVRWPLRGLAPGRVRLLGATGAVLLLLAVGWLGAPQLRLLRERPYAPLADVAALTRAASGGHEGLRAGLGLGGDMAALYDPWIRYIESRAEIEALASEARAKGLPLHVFYGYPRLNRRRAPDAVALLEDPDTFREVARFHGFEPRFTFRVFELRETR